jgi:hypothetical protein
LSVLGLVIVAGVLVWMEFGALIKGANSCVKLDDGLYYMEYNGDTYYSLRHFDKPFHFALSRTK